MLFTKRMDNTLQDFVFDLMMVAAFFNQEGHLVVQVQEEGSDEWLNTAVTVTMPETVGNGVFSKSTVYTDGTLPEKDGCAEDYVV